MVQGEHPPAGHSVREREGAERGKTAGDEGGAGGGRGSLPLSGLKRRRAEEQDVQTEGARWVLGQMLLDKNVPGQNVFSQNITMITPTLTLTLNHDLGPIQT